MYVYVKTLRSKKSRVYLNNTSWQTLPNIQIMNHNTFVDSISTVNVDPCINTEMNNECSYESGLGNTFAQSITFAKTFEAEIIHL